MKEYFLDMFTLTPSLLYIEWATSIFGIIATSTRNPSAFHTIRPLYLTLSRERFVVSIRTQAVKLHKNFVHFRYCLCVSKKNILETIDNSIETKHAVTP